MDELTLPVNHNGEELELPVRMYPYGCTFRVEVMVGETTVIFEPDEERSYRALGDIWKLSTGLPRVIAEALEKLR